MRPRNVTLSDAIDQYQASLKARSMAHNTIRSHTYLLRRALALWGNIHCASISGRHVDKLFADGGWSERTHNTNLQILRAFFAWCRNQRFMDRDQDPTFGWRNRRPLQQDKLRIPVERFAELLDAAEHPRDRALIAVGLFLFVRSSEATGILIGDVDFTRNSVRVFREKTNEEDALPMCSELREELVAYLNWYRTEQGGLEGHWFLLPARVPGSAVRDRVTGRIVQSAQKINPTRRMGRKAYEPVKAALRKVGMPTEGEGGHTLRRSGARALADELRVEGYDGALLRVASMLGHKSTKITEHYIGWSLERQQRDEHVAGRLMFGGKVSRHGQVLRVVAESEHG